MSELADEFEVVLARRDITVGGRAVTIRELTIEQAAVLHEAVSALLAALMPQYEDPGIGAGQVLAALEQHWRPHAVALLQASTGQPATWLASLGAADGSLLMVHFAALHAGFFGTRLELARPPAPSRKSRSASASASPASSGTGTPPTH